MMVSFGALNSVSSTHPLISNSEQANHLCVVTTHTNKNLTSLAL